MTKPFRILALVAGILPSLAAAQHFSLAYIDIRLTKPDSVRVTVEADGLDLLNSVRTFPEYDQPAGSGMESFRLYERRIEAYLQQKVKLRADGKPVSLAVVAWTPRGKNRDDGFDTISINSDNHAITLGGRLPSGTKLLQAWSELWMERYEVAEEAHAPTMVFHLIDGDIPLRRVWSRTERWIHFPVHPDSLAILRKSPLPPIPPRAPTDHSQHNH